VCERQTGKENKISLIRRIALFCLFFLIAVGLGYPILNRYDPRQIQGLSDVRSYAALVTGAAVPGPDHMKFRRLVPWIARSFYLLVKDKSASWDPVMFGLLVSDSLFVAGTALLIVILGVHSFGNHATSLLAAFIYLVNFAVPNLRLAGLVDAGEGFFLPAILWSLAESKFWLLPIIGVLGTLTKESFIPFSIVFTLAWWIFVRRKLQSPVRVLIWILTSVGASLLTFIVLHFLVEGRFVNPVEFGEKLHQNHQYAHQLIFSLWDREFWYIFGWLLPLGIAHLRRLPRPWLVATGAASLTVFALDAYYGGAPGTVGRALFSVAGPVLALSAASLLVRIASSVPNRAEP
jgi:hypothetical protein